MIIAKDTHQSIGQVLDNGHCMRHVQIVAGAPHSSKLRAGKKVLGYHEYPMARGTVIATFGASGTYENKTDGSSHIAIFVEKVDDGVRVVDAWQGQPVHERIIRDKKGQGTAVNDASRYYIVETV